MRILYSLGIRFYGLLIFIASFFNEKAKKRYKGQHTIFPYLKEKIDKSAKYVWFHAASLGEFEQGRPVIETLRVLHPEYKIILTFFSPSGYEVRKKYEGVDLVCYLPLDTLVNSQRFLRKVRPVKAIFIKYEFWPNYLFGCKELGIPTYVISANFRASQSFFKWYGYPYALVLRLFKHLFVQDEASVKLLSSVGIENVSIAGDTRFDRVIDIASRRKCLPIVDKFKNGESLIVAGSSWPKDEDILIRYAKEFHVKLLLAPHEIHESHLKEIEQKWGDDAIVRYSDATEETVQNAQCLVIDNFGMLSSVYQYATVAYIGGGFGVGIHNVLEAAVYAVPVLFGPNYLAFREAIELINIGGAFSVDNYETCKTILNAQLLDSVSVGKKAGDYVMNNKGATKTIVDSIFNI